MTQQAVVRTEIAAAIAGRLRRDRAELTAAWRASGAVRTVVVDDLLGADLARAIHDAFPAPATLMERKTLREHKYVGVEMDAYPPLVGEATFAFQAPEVLAEVAAITGMPDLQPDEHLYAGGISQMGKGHFLNPHLDNSHDKDVERYRSLNLLYYVTPGWQESYGGNLQLWDDGPKGTPRTLHSRFDRLAIMATNRESWHSVSPVVHDGVRCCVSNYYFSPIARTPEGEVVPADYFHVTTFRGFPQQHLRDAALTADGLLRQGIRKLRPQGVGQVKQVYEAGGEPDRSDT